MLSFNIATISQALSAAAVDQERWTTALEIAARSTGSHGALLVPLVGDMPYASTSSLTESVHDYLTNGWHLRDDRYNAVPKILKEGVATDRDCLSDDARKRSPFYQDFVGARKLSAWAGVRVGREPSWSLSLQRSSQEEPFSTSELTSLRRLASSLNAIAETSVALNHAKGHAALAAFDHSERASILLDRRGRVVRVNTSAERLLGGDIQVRGGKVVTNAAKSNSDLSLEVRRLFWDAETSTLPVLVPKASGGKFIIYPMKLPGVGDFAISAFHAILVIVDTDAKHAASIETLKRTFDLTLAEAHLAIALSHGIDLDVYLLKRGLSKETVRSHLKSIFSKTGTNRQAQLATKLLTLLPGK